MTPTPGLIEWPTVVSVHLGPLSLSPHGVGTGLGILAGAWLMLPATRRRGIPDQLVERLLIRGVLGAIIGARLAYVVNHLADYRHQPLQVFAIWAGGLSLLGGIVGGVAAALPLMRRRRLSFWTLMDAAAPGLALGILIGRIGDLVVGDHLGKPTSFVLGFRCTHTRTASPCAAAIGHGVHLPALYDLVSVSALLGLLLWLRRRDRWDGFLILVFACWYGAGRFVEDFFRIDTTHGTGLTGSQWTALAVSILSAALLIRGRTPGFGRWDLPDSDGDQTSGAGGASTGPSDPEPSEVSDRTSR